MSKKNESILTKIIYIPTTVLSFISNTLYSIYLTFLPPDKLKELKKELEEEIDAIVLAEQKQTEQLTQELIDDLEEYGLSLDDIEELTKESSNNDTNTHT